jgi:hypothetical protein
MVHLGDKVVASTTMSPVERVARQIARIEGKPEDEWRRYEHRALVVLISQWRS